MVRYKYYKNSRSGLAWSRPRADRGLSRPTSVFHITIDVCKIFYPDRLRFGSTRAKNLFWSKNRERSSIGLAVNNKRRYIMMMIIHCRKIFVAFPSLL